VGGCGAMEAVEEAVEETTLCEGRERGVISLTAGR
jgi:hypothetical protein